MGTVRVRCGLVALCVVLYATTASAQVFGTLSWQMQPYCNVVTMTLTVAPTGFALEGYDNQCGAATRGSATGHVVLNPNGSAGVNFTIVTSPGGQGVHVSGIVNVGTGSGTWTDSVGNNGTFALGGAVSGLPARPQPASGLAPASVVATDVAPGAIGATQINQAQVQARVSGTCAVGQSLRGINADGTVICQTLPGGADQAGSFLDASFVAELPAPGSTLEVVPTTFVAPITGFARLVGRGTCQFQPAAPGDVDAEISVGLSPSAAFSGASSRRARLKINSNGDTQLGWSTEHRVSVIAGAPYTVAVYMRRTLGAIPDTCSGTLSVTFATFLP